MDIKAKRELRLVQLYAGLDHLMSAICYMKETGTRSMKYYRATDAAIEMLETALAQLEAEQKMMRLVEEVEHDTYGVVYEE